MFARFLILFLLLPGLLFGFACATGGGDDSSDDGIAPKDDDDDDESDDDTVDDDDTDDDDTDDDDTGDDDNAPCRDHDHWTVGLTKYREGSFEGYTLLAPMPYTETYLIDHCGRVVNTWHSSYTPGHAAYLLENGNLLRTAKLGTHDFTAGGDGGLLEMFDWDGNLVWEYEYISDEHIQHHDIEVLPNGNILILAWEIKDEATCLAAGIKPWMLTQGELLAEHIIEVEPTGSSGGNIVWHWHLWDHLVQDYDATKDNYGTVSAHPELLDINFDRGGGSDWNHANAIDYNEDFDQIIISVRVAHEFWVIDHSTSAAQAAGHTGGSFGKGGDFLYRWGNPQNYGLGIDDDQVLFAQHDAHWIESGLVGAGNILLFNNGTGRPDGDYSSVMEISPPVDDSGNYTRISGQAFGPLSVTWYYYDDDHENFYSPTISGAQRMPNGNTLICNGDHGQIFEVNSDGEVVWEYISPVLQAGPMAQGDDPPEGPYGTKNRLFRAYRYGPDYGAFDGRDMTAGDYIELPDK